MLAGETQFCANPPEIPRVTDLTGEKVATGNLYNLAYRFDSQIAINWILCEEQAMCLTRNGAGGVGRPAPSAKAGPAPSAKADRGKRAQRKSERLARNAIW